MTGCFCLELYTQNLPFAGNYEDNNILIIDLENKIYELERTIG